MQPMTTAGIATIAAQPQVYCRSYRKPWIRDLSPLPLRLLAIASLPWGVDR